MYRNDHDAALARIDALEIELERVNGELAAKPVLPKARRIYPRLIAGMILAAVCAIGAFARLHRSPEAPPSASAPGEAYDDPARQVCALP